MTKRRYRKDEAQLRSCVEHLSVRESLTGSPTEERRLGSIRRDAVKWFDAEEARTRGEIPLACPVCDVVAEFTLLKCSNCGSALDWNALYSKTGIWKVYVAYVILLSALACSLGLVAGVATYPPAVRVGTAFGSAFFVFWSVPSWLRVGRFLRWTLRNRERRR